MDCIAERMLRPTGNTNLSHDMIDDQVDGNPRSTVFTPTRFRGLELVRPHRCST